MKKVIVKIVRSDGNIFLADNSDWKIYELEGIDAPKTNVYSQENAVGDGVTVTGLRTVAKDFILSCSCNKNHLNEIMRKFVVSFFNPKYTYCIYVTYMGVEKWCSARLYMHTTPTVNIYRNISFTAQFVREEAYWKSVDEFARDIAGVDNKYGYPLFDVPNVGTLYDVFNFGKMVEITNDGDVECYCTAVIHADGDVINPTVIKNDKHIKVIDTLHSGDVYSIDFVNLTVTKNGANALNKIDRTSDFTQMQFDVGRNILSYSAELGENVMHVTLYFNKLYLGV